MDSINRQQDEHNRQDMQGREAVEKVKELGSGICFFCTRRALGDSGGVRPMAVQKVDEEGNLWFLSADDSHKNLELAQDPTVELYFQGGRAEYLYLTGHATVSRDRAKIEELWNPIAKTWFTEGKDDPRITVIRVRPTGGYYWDTKHGGLVAGIKILIGAAVGKTMDDSIEGRIEVV